MVVPGLVVVVPDVMRPIWAAMATVIVTAVMLVVFVFAVFVVVLVLTVFVIVLVLAVFVVVLRGFVVLAKSDRLERLRPRLGRLAILLELGARLRRGPCR